jgi:hypothetical protein
MNMDSIRGRTSRNGGPNEFNSFIWVIDAHPEDIREIDYIKPNGDTVMRTVADYRQLNDALFHAGERSGSAYEWIDEPNRLQFYVIDLHRDARGIRSYTIAVRSLDGAGPHTRGVALAAPAQANVSAPNSPITFTLRNTGTTAATDPSLHAQDARSYLTSDVYRLSVTAEGAGWSASLPNALVTAPAGGSASVTVHVTRGSGAGAVTMRAVSESDPSQTATITWRP